MERRNWSLEALESLYYIDSLDPSDRADALIRWYQKYLNDYDITDFDLEIDDLKSLHELFHKNINFLKGHKEQVRQEMISNKKRQKFLKN